MAIWCRLRDSNPRPTVYKTVALPAELNRRCARRLAISEEGRAQGRALQAEPAATVGAQGPGAGRASSIPGQGGMVIATKLNGAPASARN